MPFVRIVAATCLFIFGSGAASAGSSDTATGRYAMQPVDGGMLRLDTQTGQMALCSNKPGRWTCDPIDGQANTDADQIAKLEAENRDLKNRLKTLEEGRAAIDPAAPPPGTMQLPTEQEVDQAFDYVESIFKKFRDRLQKLEPAPPAPKTDNGGAL